MMKTGIYRHYKGKDYQVIGVALHTETQEKTVLYHALYDCPDLKDEYGDNPVFARPYAMFTGTIEYEGKTVPRFEYIGDAV